MKNFLKQDLSTKKLDAVLNPFGSIAEDWMLVTAGSGTDRTEWNTMTASWGGFGYLWNKPVAFVFVRPTRFTAKFTEELDTMSLAFFNSGDKEIRKMLTTCGTVSGRDVDKAKETGLMPTMLDKNIVGFEQAKIVLACKKLYREEFTPDKFLAKDIDKNYPKKDYHIVYICEIVDLFTKE